MVFNWFFKKNILMICIQMPLLPCISVICQTRNLSLPLLYCFCIENKFIEFLLLACVSCFGISGIFQEPGVLKLGAIVYFHDFFNPRKFSWLCLIILDNDKLILWIRWGLSLVTEKTCAAVEEVFSCDWTLFSTEKTDFKSF